MNRCGCYDKEVVKEFTLQRLHLASSTLGRFKGDVRKVVRDIGGLQYGGHEMELLNRFETFRSEWLGHCLDEGSLMEGHVLRGALRIVNTEDYPYYFKATRSVARRRRYQNCPLSLATEHRTALGYLSVHGPVTPSRFEAVLGEAHPSLRGKGRRLLYDLYNHGEAVRTGRDEGKPLYHSLEGFPSSSVMLGLAEEEAQEWLLSKCLEVYGPSSMRDIAHWTGWTMSETKKIACRLIGADRIQRTMIEGETDPYYTRVEDLRYLDMLGEDLPQRNSVRILFNDDALLLGCYLRLESFYGYRWTYPQLSDGVVWKAAFLRGRQIIGESVVEMYAKSPSYRVRSLKTLAGQTDHSTISQIQDEFTRQAEYLGKQLEMARPWAL